MLIKKWKEAEVRFGRRTLDFFTRSTAIVAAYLMKKKNMSAAEALLYLRKSREVKPNVGFLQQLGKLDDELRAQRYRRY